MPDFDVAIVGGGVTGFAAAMYSGRFGLKTVLFSESTGGTIILTDSVENYPGFKKLTGMELASNIQEHALEYGVEVVDERVEKIEKTQDGSFTIFSSPSGKTFSSKTIILATGTRWRKLGVPGEKEFSNKGVHYCALCDGALYKGKMIAVAGGGDSATKEALLLTQWGSKVTMFARGEKLRAEPINLERAKNNPKLEVVTKTNIVEVKGGVVLQSLILDKEFNGSKEFPVDALFVEIGHLPVSELAKQLGVAVNEKEEIIIDRDSKTSVPGVFAAGDVCDSKFKQAITGVAEGVCAAHSAYQFVSSNGLK